MVEHLWVFDHVGFFLLVAEGTIICDIIPSERNGQTTNDKELLERGRRRGIALWRTEDELDSQENQQMEIWSEGFSNEGHVYAALGVDPASLAFKGPTCLPEIPANVKQRQTKSR